MDFLRPPGAVPEDEFLARCGEVGPFDAVVFGQEPGLPVAVPHVEAAGCAGCGSCENACPVGGVASIRVFATDALRLAQGSDVAEGLAQGLAIALDSKPHGVEGYPAATRPRGDFPRGSRV